MSDEILFEKINQWGVITLNRPKALNALTHGMVKAMYAKLLEWEKDDSVAAVMVQGEGERGFCAGGDIRWLYDTAKDDTAAACEFFRDEYTNNAAIFHFPKPYVALIDGIVMGGGVGVSVHGDFRVAGDNTLFAMPETGIGLFPDVGGGYFMPRLEGGLGLYYALTGARAKAADCLATGIATHYVPSEKNADLKAGLLALDFSKGVAHDVLKTCLDGFGETRGDAPIASLRKDIDRLFSDIDSMDALIGNLEGDPTEFAENALKVLNGMSPTSLRLTFEQMSRGGALNFNELMQMEFRVVSRVMANHDFFEGVRALIIDKDKSPKWSPESISDISDNEVFGYFEELGAQELSL